MPKTSDSLPVKFVAGLLFKCGLACVVTFLAVLVVGVFL